MQISDKELQKIKEHVALNRGNGLQEPALKLIAAYEGLKGEVERLKELISPLYQHYDRNVHLVAVKAFRDPDRYPPSLPEFLPKNPEIVQLREEVERLKELMSSHGPEGYNYTNAEYVRLLQDRKEYKDQSERYWTALEQIAPYDKWVGHSSSVDATMVRQIGKIASKAIQGRE